MKDNLLLIAILVAGVLVAGALIYNKKTNNTDPITDKTNVEQKYKTVDFSISPITENDHILGSSDADITIVEYSDTECPFCKNFHETLRSVVAKDSDVAWVYRHFPIANLHSKARNESQATECAYRQGGNDAFWSYINRVYEVTTSNNTLDPKELQNIAKENKLDMTKFNVCLTEAPDSEKIDNSISEATKNGALGTPFSVFELKNELSEDKKTTIQGMFEDMNAEDYIVFGNDNKSLSVGGAMPETLIQSLIDAIKA